MGRQGTQAPAAGLPVYSDRPAKEAAVEFLILALFVIAAVVSVRQVCARRRTLRARSRRLANQRVEAIASAWRAAH